MEPGLGLHREAEHTADCLMGSRDLLLSHRVPAGPMACMEPLERQRCGTKATPEVTYRLQRVPIRG